MDKSPRSARVRWLLTGVVAVLFTVGAAPRQTERQAAPEMEALKKATVNGKYTDLLAVIRMPNDKTTYGEFNDYGPYSGTAWGPYMGLPPGNWVYVYPHWYIWGKQGPGGDALP